MTVTEVTSLAQFHEIINKDEPSVFDFWATWCGPCKVIGPVFSKFAELEEFKGVGFYKVDTDAVGAITHEVGIRAMPTFIAFQKGEKKGQVLGARPAEIKKLIEESLPKPAATVA